MTRRSWGPGFTLIEMLVALTVMSALLTAVTSTMLSLQRGFVAQRENAQAEQSLRAAQLTVAAVLRSAGANPGGGATGLLDPDPEGHGRFDNIRVVSDFNPVDGDTNDPLEDVLVLVQSDTLLVRWTAAGSPEPMAYPVRDILFEYYATDGTALTVPSQVLGATRVRFIVEAPRVGMSERTTESWWIYLRNR